MRIISTFGSLLALGLHGSGITAGATQPRSNVIPQAHDSHHYYAMHLEPQFAPSDVARILEMKHEGPIGELEDHHLFSEKRIIPDRLSKNGEIVSKIEMLRKGDEALESHISKQDHSRLSDGIRFIEQQKPKRLYKRGPLPPPVGPVPRPSPSEMVSPIIAEVARDLSIRDPLFSSQWHLVNAIQLGHDVNVTGVWRNGIFGQNVTVAIVDDGLDMDSRDLKDNYFAGGSYDFNDHNLVPKPKLIDDQHGTRCAGEIAAVKNDVCGVGVAYGARVSGLRILSGEISDADEAIALNYAYHENHIFSCSWGPPDDGRSMDAPGLLVKRAFVNGINKGRSGLGNVYVFASGNGGSQDDNCNFDGYTNSIYSITVAAVDRQGQHPYYSELCSANMVVTYSSGSGDYIHTTDVGENKCSDHHGGTSAAAPLAAGIFSLALSVRPDLTWRDLQHLCVETAQMVDPEDEDWEETAAGYKFNHKYGFGKLDAYKLVEAAKTFPHLKPQAWYHGPDVVVEKEIPDNDAHGIESQFKVTKKALEDHNLERLEHVQVLMNLTHQRRGDVVIDLKSPNGVVSHIATRRRYDQNTNGMLGWYFMSVKHWGEDGIGDWTVTVYDSSEGFNGTFHRWSLILWGEAIDPSITKPHPLPGDYDWYKAEKPQPTISPPELIEQPSVVEEPPLETNTRTTISATEGPTSTSVSDNQSTESNFWRWPTANKMVWLYVAIAGIAFFLSCIGVWICIQKRKARERLIHGDAREHYEFEMLPNMTDDDGLGRERREMNRTRTAGELYDAFAGDESFDGDPLGPEKRIQRRSVGDSEMGDDDVRAFLDDSDEEDDRGEEKKLIR